MDTEEGSGEYDFSQSAPLANDGTSRSSRSPPPTFPSGPATQHVSGGSFVTIAFRLARKAESARQARLRHKQFVTDLQQQVDAAQERVRQLESFCKSGPGSATVAVRELQNALKPEQLQQLQQWCAVTALGPCLASRPCPALRCRCIHRHGRRSPTSPSHAGSLKRRGSRTC